MTLHAADPWRPAFHIAPRRGLLNDPNGLVHWDGAFHIFYQWNPTGCTHANKNWAHLRSPDLIHWEELPIALAPVDSFDSHGCYSGSAVVDGKTLVLVYNGNVRDAGGERQTYQCLATSSDGISFEKLGPVISGPLPGYTAHFRDPKVWRAADGSWRMVIGAQTTELEGTVLLLRGTDLTRWTLDRQLLAPGAFGYMCECPDFFRIDDTAILIFCEQSTVDGRDSNLAGYVRADLGATARRDAFHRLDHGRDFYAPQTFTAPDGRRLMLAWMGLPEQDEAPSIAHGWMHCLTLPRELQVKGGRLCQQPARELATLRKAHTALGGLTVEGLHVLPLRAAAFELAVAWNEEPSTPGGAPQAAFTLDLRAGDTERTSLRIDPAARRLALETVQPDGATVPLGDATVPDGWPFGTVRIFVDRSSVEVFAADGAVTFSARIFPSPGADALRVRADDTVTFTQLDVWTL